MKSVSTVRSLIAKHPQLLLFGASVALLSASGGIMETTFNNYVSDVFHRDAAARGWLEFPRELPGFLTALSLGISINHAVSMSIPLLGGYLWMAHGVMNIELFYPEVSRRSGRLSSMLNVRCWMFIL